MNSSASEVQITKQTTSRFFWKRTEFKIGVVFLALAAFVVSQASGMPKSLPGSSFGPGIMPTWLGIGIGVLSLILIGQAVVSKKEIKESPLFELSEVFSVGTMFIILFVYLGVMDYLGFGLDTFLLVTYVARRLGKYAIWKCAILGAITGSLTVYLFRILLDMPLPIGFLGF